MSRGTRVVLRRGSSIRDDDGGRREAGDVDVDVDVDVDTKGQEGGLSTREKSDSSSP